MIIAVFSLVSVLVTFIAYLKSMKIHFALIPQFASKFSNSTFQQQMVQVWDLSQARVLALYLTHAQSCIT